MFFNLGDSEEVSGTDEKKLSHVMKIVEVKRQVDSGLFCCFIFFHMHEIFQIIF